MLTPYGFISSSISGTQFNEGSTISGSDGVNYFFERTNADAEFTFKAKNNAADDRQFDWLILGISYA